MRLLRAEAEVAHLVQNLLCGLSPLKGLLSSLRAWTSESIAAALRVMVLILPLSPLGSGAIGTGAHDGDDAVEVLADCGRRFLEWLEKPPWWRPRISARAVLSSASRTRFQTPP